MVIAMLLISCERLLLLLLILLRSTDFIFGIYLMDLSNFINDHLLFLLLIFMQRRIRLHYRALRSNNLIHILVSDVLSTVLGSFSHLLFFHHYQLLLH
jgi:hypothetical protein